MFCEVCGRVLNRATGRCVCGDGAPVPVGATTVAAEVGGAEMSGAEPPDMSDALLSALGSWDEPAAVAPVPAAPLPQADRAPTADLDAGAADLLALLGGLAEPDAQPVARARPEPMAPIEPVTPAPVPAAEPNPPAGWYPDHHSGGQRWWDGSAWTEHAALATPAAVAPSAVAAAAPWDLGRGHDVRLGTVPRVRWRRKVYDLHVFSDRLVLSRVRGTNPETIGVLVGFLCGGFVLAFVGAQLAALLARGGNQRRIAAGHGVSPDVLAGHDGRVLTEEGITSGDVRAFALGGRITLVAGGRTEKMRWGRTSVGSLDVPALVASLPKVTARRETAPRMVAQVAGYVFLAMVAVRLTILMLAIPFAVLGGANDATTSADQPAVSAAADTGLATACAPWVDLAGRPSASLPEVGAAASQVRQPLADLAASRPELQAAAAGAALVDDVIGGRAPGIGDLQLRAAANAIDSACL